MHPIVLLFLLLLITVTVSIYCKRTVPTTTRFKVVVTTYNAGSDKITSCLNSIDKQSYPKHLVDVYIVDDASTKNTQNNQKIIKDFCHNNKWGCMFKQKNGGPMESRIQAIERLGCKDEDVIVLIDGDDRLYNNKVFSILNRSYQDETLATCGNFIDEVGGKITPSSKSRSSNYCPAQHTALQLKGGDYRKTGWLYSHLKTFKYKVYKHIDHNDLKRNGRYIQSATDLALFYPILEMSGGKYKCISDILYIYTQDHPENYHNSSDSQKKNSQADNANYVINLNRYKPIF